LPLSRSFRLVLCVILFAIASGCQLKSEPASAGLITADPGAFVVHSVERYYDQSGSADSMIVVVKATYTNHDSNPQLVSASKFQLLDPNLMAIYFGISGGNINIPSMPDAQVDPGKSVDIAVGFRVPSSTSTARLTYRP
jgi:hypothetical protein